MCLYVTSNPDDGLTFLVHPTPTVGDAMEDLYQQTYECSNMCTANKNNGVCDDGGPGSEYNRCSYGQDCDDCGNRYAETPNEVANGRYAVTTHPSEEKLAWYWKDAKWVYTDSMITVGNHSGVTMVKTPMRKESLDYVAQSFSGHQYGLGKCHWIRSCTASEIVGDKCSAVQAQSVTYDGFCFESSTGSLECGHLTAKTDKWGLNEILIDAPKAGRSSILQYACPHKAPVVTLGANEHDVNRMLIGGCMLSNDTSYSSLAEVHVPQMCDAPADYMKGCLFPRAINYDMSALQSDTCYYNVQGCTDSLAVNYNVEANTDDGTCITAVKGCTMKSQYQGIASDTPQYHSSYVGVPIRHIGAERVADAYSTTGALLTTANNYLATANVLEGCILTVEGCMDSTALNYDSYANINSNTWCVPVVTGCMMPSTWSANTAYDSTRTLSTATDGLRFNYPAATTTRTHSRDGLAANFNPLATVHDLDSCAVERYGCTDSTAFNYEEHATSGDTGSPPVEGSSPGGVFGYCAPKEYGCLHPGALNYGCKNKYVADGNTPPYPLQGVPCTGPGNIGTWTASVVAYDSLPLGAAIHDSNICNFGFVPPSPPPSQVSGDSVIKVRIGFVAAENLEYFTPDILAVVCAKLTEVAGLTADEVTSSDCTATAGSSNVNGDIVVKDVAAQTKGKSNLQNALDSTEAASGALGLEVLTVPTVSAVIENPAGGDDNTAVIVGATVGGLFGGLILFGVAYYIMKRKQSKVEA